MNLAQTQEECLVTMHQTQHHESQNVHEHGLSARDHYRNIRAILEGKQPDIYGLPPQLTELARKRELLPQSTTDLYQEWHDCGKPYCKTVDEHGRVHYPNHAEVSYEQFGLLFPQESIAGELVRRDMDYHTARNNEDFAKLAPTPHAFTLYLTAWAEIFANAALFGGTGSDGFKMRRKRLEKALKSFNERQESP